MSDTVFRDRSGTQWRVQMTISIAETLRRHFQIDWINKPGESVNDPQSIWQTLWEMVRDQANGMGIGEDEFDARIASDDVVRLASRAVLEALSDFFHQIRRPGIARMMKTTAKHWTDGN
ncbi:MAG: hypothetical protein AAFP90_09100 [Planctomycetota bacterium]